MSEPTHQTDRYWIVNLNPGSKVDPRMETNVFESEQLAKLHAASVDHPTEVLKIIHTISMFVVE